MIFTIPQLVCQSHKVTDPQWKPKLASLVPADVHVKSNLVSLKELGFSNADVQFCWTSTYVLL